MLAAKASSWTARPARASIIEDCHQLVVEGLPLGDDLVTHPDLVTVDPDELTLVRGRA